MIFATFLILVLSTFATSDFTPSTATDVRRFDDECGALNSIPSDRLELFKKGEFTDDRLSKCHIHCVAKKMGIFDDTTGPIVANLIAQLKSNNDKTTEEIKAEVEKCSSSDLKQNDSCDWAFIGFGCLTEAGLKVSPDVQ